MLCWAAACCSCSCGQAAARSLAAPCLWSEQTRTQRDCDFPLLLLDTSPSSNCAARAEAAGTAAVSPHQTLIHTIWITYKYKCMKCCRVHITAIIIKILQSFEVGGKINKTVWRMWLEPNQQQLAAVMTSNTLPLIRGLRKIIRDGALQALQSLALPWLLHNNV